MLSPPPELLSQVSSSTWHFDVLPDPCSRHIAWAALSGKERGSFLKKLADEIKKHADELADLEVASIGKPKMWALMENDWAREYIDTAVVSIS